MKDSDKRIRTQEEVIFEKLDAAYDAKPLNGKSVLSVEDQIPLRNAIDHILRCAGADVTTVGNGTQAFRLVQDAMSKTGSISFDLILTDSEMNLIFLTTFLDQIR